MTHTNVNIFVGFYYFIRKIIGIILIVLFTTYLLLLLSVYFLQFLTWEPIIEVANIPTDSVQKFQRYENNLINTFTYLLPKLQEDK